MRLGCAERLLKVAGCRVYLTLDNLESHRARKVKDWLVKHEEEIEVFHLPGYGPELNPDECSTRT